TKKISKDCNEKIYNEIQLKAVRNSISHTFTNSLLVLVNKNRQRMYELASNKQILAFSIFFNSIFNGTPVNKHAKY
ncbi:hypothetical protein BpHYR1_040652, partial [Brachionus plicatilis]